MYPRLRPLSVPLHVVLVRPQIPPNTGNVARLCAVTGARLELVGPLGFSIADKDLRRAGLDYWDQVFLRYHDSYDAYLAATPSARRWLLSTHGTRSVYAADFREGDHLVFGSETAGLGTDILQGGSGNAVALPMLDGRRSLNLATACGIVTYEALRQIQGMLETYGGPPPG